MKQQDQYGEPTTYHYPGWTVRVYRPILSEEERARRMKVIADAAAALILQVEQAQRAKKAEGESDGKN